MLEQAVVYSYLGVMLAGMLGNMVGLIARTSRDLSVIKNRPRRIKRQPLVSVLIYAHNDGHLIELCLNSIVKSSYRKYEIIVVDNGSKDDTKQIIKNFKSNRRKKTIRLLSKRRESGKGSALNAAFTAHVKGQLVVVVDASSVLDKHAIRNAAQYFSNYEQLSAVSAQVRALPHPSIIGLLQQFDYLSRSRAKRANKTFVEDGTAVFYRREVFRKLKYFNQSKWKKYIAINLSRELPKEVVRVVHASNVVVYIEPLTKYSQLIAQRYCWALGLWQAYLSSKPKWVWMPLTLLIKTATILSPFILTYFIYLALTVHYSVLLAISWAAVTIYLFFFTWSDPYTSLSQRLRLSFFIPITFSVYYITTFIQATIQLLCIFSLNQKTKVRSKKSPKGPVLRSRTVS